MTLANVFIAICTLALAWGLVGLTWQGMAQHTSTTAFVLGDNERNQRVSLSTPREPGLVVQEQFQQSPVLSEIQHGLRVGTAWVVVRDGRQKVLRVGLEFQGRVVSAVSLEPGSGEPVPYEFRNSFYPIRPLTQSHIAARLRAFRLQLNHLRLGESGVVSAGIVQVPLLWNNRLLNYLRYDPRTGQVLTNPDYTLEQNRSSLKSR